MRTQRTLGRVSALLVSAAALLATDVAIAQVDELVVTARKREESLLDVPVAVTAFTSQAISQRKIIQLEDVALQTPGFTFEDFSNGGFGTPVIRGTTQQNITNLENNVSTFFGGVYLPRAYLVDIGIVDLERVEVVKGPQSALYGQNAFMGAVNYVPNAATNEFGAQAEITIGNDELWEASGSINVPIVQDILAIRGTYAYSEFDGTWNNNHPLAGLDINPGLEGNQGGWEKDYYSAAISFTPVQSLEIFASYDNWDSVTESNPGASRIESAEGTTNCGIGDLLFCGTFTTPPESSLIQDPRHQGLNLQTEIIRAGFEWDVTDAVSLSYLFGHVESEVYTQTNSTNDAINGRLPFQSFPGFLVFVGTPIGELNYNSHEVRLAYDNDGAFRGEIGGFHSNGIDKDFFNFGFFAPVLPGDDVMPLFPSSPGLFLISETVTETDVWAVFFAATYEFWSDRARLNFEGRYTSEEKDIGRGAQNDTFKYFTPRITAEWDITDSTLLYVSAARGVKAGGFNSPPSLFGGEPLVAGEEKYDPDKNWTYEAGVKSSLWDNRIQLTGAVFYIDWNELQINSRPTTPPALVGIIMPGDPVPGITSNLGDARVFGVELEGVASVTEQLTVNAGFSYANAEYEDGTISQRLLRLGGCDDIVCPIDGDIGGKELARTSPLQANVGAIWEDQFFNTDLGYYVRGDLTWQSRQWGSEVNSAKIPSRTLVNGIAALTHDNWEVQLWAKNMFNEKYVNNAFVVFTSASSYAPAIAPKRTFGVTFKAKF